MIVASAIVARLDDDPARVVVHAAQAQRTTVSVPLITDPDNDYELDEKKCFVGEMPAWAVDEGLGRCELARQPGDPEPRPLAFDHIPGQVYGYSEPYKYVSAVTGEGVIVLPETVQTATSGPWRALGLVRNETTKEVKATLQATLLDAAGTVLDRPTAEILVDPLRPGEPAPFDLSSSVAGAAVDQVRWEVRVAAPSGSTRRFHVEDDQLGTYGDPRTRSGIRPGPPYPYVEDASATNASGMVVHNPTLVGAWVGDSPEHRGKVLHVVTVPLHDDRGRPLESLGPDQAGRFRFVIDDAVLGPLVNDADPLFWVVGR